MSFRPALARKSLHRVLRGRIRTDMLQWIILALGLYLCAGGHWFAGLLLVLISGRWLAAAVGVLLLALAAAALMAASDSTPSDIRTPGRPMECLSSNKSACRHQLI